MFKGENWPPFLPFAPNRFFPSVLLSYQPEFFFLLNNRRG